MGMSLKLEITLKMCSTALNQGLRLREKSGVFYVALFSVYLKAKYK